jgi:hypothetical protein
MLKVKKETIGWRPRLPSGRLPFEVVSETLEERNATFGVRVEPHCSGSEEKISPTGKTANLTGEVGVNVLHGVGDAKVGQ